MRSQIPARLLRNLRRRFILFAIFSIAFSTLPASRSVPEEETGQIGPSDPVEVEAFFDGMMSTQLREKEIAGAVVSVVRDGEILLSKGYGYADVESRRPIDPERTLFRIGSVTKLFTWTAVMQLVEQGRLDLEADINQYVGFQIPETYPEAITLTHLMTHTPGFEEDLRDIFTESLEMAEPLGDWLAARIPARVRPPGVFAAYSNYGTALAGHIVERVSGISWEEYVERFILEPLQMRQTTALQPLPESLAGDMSHGYSRKGGLFEAQPWEFMPGDAPAGSISASASDMARFMSAHLNHGFLGESRILGRETSLKMQKRHFHHDLRLPGFSLGFYEMNSHGERIIGHSGGTQWFHTLLLLFPERKLGIFVSYNTDSAGALTFNSLLATILDRYFPEPPPEFSAASPEELKRLTGVYRFNRMSYTTYQKVLGLLLSVRLRADGGALVADSPIGTFRMKQVEPRLFREELGSIQVAFRGGQDAPATHAFLSVAPMMALERVPWHGEPRLHFLSLVAGLVASAGMLAGGAAGWIRGRFRPSAAAPRAVVLTRRALLGAAVCNVGFIVWMAVLASDMWSLLRSPLTGLKLALSLPVLGLVFHSIAIVGVALMWQFGFGSRWLRVCYTLIALLGLLFAWSLNYWNLLGWRM